MNPYRMLPHTHIAVSGGRTSGYMLRMILDAHGGTLPPGVVPIFCNTGKEASGTLDFVERMSLEWGVEIVWLEFTSRARLGFNVVNYATASRKGEPFQALIRTKQRLPNVAQRMCTEWLKVLTAHRYCRNVLLWESYDTALGLRDDEPRRVAKLAPDTRTPGEEPFAPLAKARATLADVRAFWKTQPFDLQIDDDAGNCDLCFLKGVGQRSRLIRNQPGVADWWNDQEQWVRNKTGGRAHDKFSKGLSIRQLIDGAETCDVQGELFPDCRCTD